MLTCILRLVSRNPTIKPVLATLRLAVFSLSAVLGAGCANFSGEHFLMAYNPETDVTNYYRVKINGNVRASQAKYSSGQYDRDAVNQLFGEGVLEREYLTSHLSVLVSSTDEQLKELTSTLEASRTAVTQIRKEQLHQSYAVASGLIEEYKTEIDQIPELKNRFSQAIARAESLRKSALVNLTQNQFTEAAGVIRQIQVIVSALRLAVDAKTIVRFFDADGLEIDVRNKKEVIFVATDTGQFTQALNQLTQAEDASKNLIQVFLGDEIRQTTTLNNQIKLDQDLDTAKAQRIADVLKPVLTLPTDKSGMNAADQNTERIQEKEALNRALLETASVIAGTSSTFSSSDEINSFARGMEMASGQ